MSTKRVILGSFGKGHGILVFIFVISMLLLFVPRIHSDGRGYYAYIRSIAIDHDLDFSNEFSEFTDDPRGLPLAEVRTKTGYVQNPWSVGPAVLWIPFFLLAHLAASALSSVGMPVSASGYSLPYVLSASFGSAFYAFMGLLLVYDLSLRHFRLSRWASFLAVISIWFGSSFTMYMYREPAMVHSFSFFAVALFLYLFFLPKDDRSVFDWLLLGLAAGLMMLVRWQTAAFLLLPLAHSSFQASVFLRTGQRDSLKKLAIGWAAFLGTASALFLPQIAVWRIIYGQYLLIPHDLLLRQGKTFMNWTSPHFWDVLFSTRHGFFTWTPVVVFALPGFVRWYRRDRITVAALLASFVVQVYMNGAGEDWYGGASFGYRRLIEVLPVFVLGLAFWLDGFRSRRSPLLAGLGVCALVVWNLLFLIQYNRLLIPSMSSLTFNQMVTQKFQLPAREIYLFFAAKYVKDLPAAYEATSGRFYLSILTRVFGLGLASTFVGVLAERLSRVFRGLLTRNGCTGRE